jgi:hypothetical protein
MAGAVALVRTIQLLSKKSLKMLGIHCCVLPLLMGMLIVVKMFNGYTNERRRSQ